MKNQSIKKNLDWSLLIIYFALVIIGWLNIYSASLPLVETSIFDVSQIYGRQMLFILLTIPLVYIILTVNPKIYENYATLFFGLGIVLLFGLFLFGATIKGQTNWYRIGSFTFQPSEFVKISCALFLAKNLGSANIDLSKTKQQLLAIAIILLPVALISMQPDIGSAMIFLSLFFVLNREGLPSWYIWTGVILITLFISAITFSPKYIIIFVSILMLIHYFLNRKITRNPIIYGILFVFLTLFIFSVDFVYQNVLETHHKDRIDVLFGKSIDTKNEGYNLNQSMITIGSGGFLGKGYLQGTQTKGNFVPAQHTDYIFTTVGEEWGFLGSFFVIALFVALILRIIYLSENQKSKFTRIYGYAVACILFTHFILNTAMLVKLFPTIGVPLPFFSYGGSSFWAFSILLFIFIKLDANKVNEW